MSGTDWSDVGVTGLLPTGTVTLLLADVEGSTRLWATQHDEMTAAIGRLDRAVAEIVANHGGVRPVEQGEGDSFVAAFARATDAVECALELQSAPLAPIRLRIGLHTGEVQLRDEGNYVGPTVNRTARLRDLAHGGQTVLSAATEQMVVDWLPVDAWLTDLGTHKLRDVPRPERVMQLCHSDLSNDFPPLRTADTVAVEHLPVQLTKFVGREEQIAQVLAILAGERLVTLTGAGGAGKTRLAVHVASEIATEFPDGVWYVDLAPITHRDMVPMTVARTLGLPDQPGRSTVDVVTGFMRARRMLVVLDNCEHLLDATADLVTALLGAAPDLTLLATSREPLGVSGEVTSRVSSLSPREAIELLTDRARRVHPDFSITDENQSVAVEICSRLDGMPLAIELAAARVRALSLTEIVNSLHDRFRLLTGGTRTAVRRQQTLRASVDWSHALLSEPERVLLRRVAAFMGGFDLDAAYAVGGAGDSERYQILDQLLLLVDKSLVIAESSSSQTRYRMLETVRQYALEKLGESGEADAVRCRHRDYYTAMAVALDAPMQNDHEQRVKQVEVEIDNLRSAFEWSCESGDIEEALILASSLQPLWLAWGRIREGLGWLDVALAVDSAHGGDFRAARAKVVADKTSLLAWSASPATANANAAEAEQALALGREIGDAGLVIRALIALCAISANRGDVASPYFAEAAELARAEGDSWRLSQTLSRQALAAMIVGDPIGAVLAAEEGREVANAIGDRFDSRHYRWIIGCTQIFQGDLAGATEQIREVIAEASAANDVIYQVNGRIAEALALAYQGDVRGARIAADTALEDASRLLESFEGACRSSRMVAFLATGDTAAAWEASEAARADPQQYGINIIWSVQAALAYGELKVARRYAHDAVADSMGWWLPWALVGRARVELADGNPEKAESDAHEALGSSVGIGAHLIVPEALECLAASASELGSQREAARLLGAAAAARRRMGSIRFKILDAGYDELVGSLRDKLGDKDFDGAFAEGEALSTEEASPIASAVEENVSGPPADGHR